jgi:hypothetical protein
MCLENLQSRIHVSGLTPEGAVDFVEGYSLPGSGRTDTYEVQIGSVKDKDVH